VHDQLGQFRVTVTHYLAKKFQFGMVILVEGQSKFDEKRGASVSAKKLWVVDDEMVNKAQDSVKDYMIVMVEATDEDTVNEVLSVIPSSDTGEVDEAYHLVPQSLQDGSYHELDYVVSPSLEEVIGGLPSVLNVLTVKEMVLT